MDISPDAKKRLAALIEERDAPLAPLAAKIGVSQSTLWNFIYGNTKNFSKIHRLATELKVSLDWLLNGDAAVGVPSTAFKLSEAGPGAAIEASIPVLGRAAGENDGVLIDMREKIGETERHPAQKNMKGAFAFCVRGETMSPRYRPGELAYAAARKPPGKGQDCIVELANGAGYLREFIAHKGDFVLCRQLSPAKEVKWRVAEIKALHAVVGRG